MGQLWSHWFLPRPRLVSLSVLPLSYFRHRRLANFRQHHALPSPTSRPRCLSLRPTPSPHSTPYFHRRTPYPLRLCHVSRLRLLPPQFSPRRHFNPSLTRGPTHHTLAHSALNAVDYRPFSSASTSTHHVLHTTPTFLRYWLRPHRLEVLRKVSGALHCPQHRHLPRPRQHPVAYPSLRLL
jgi:hypothetical protein